MTIEHIGNGYSIRLDNREVMYVESVDNLGTFLDQLSSAIEIVTDGIAKIAYNEGYQDGVLEINENRWQEGYDQCEKEHIPKLQESYDKGNTAGYAQALEDNDLD